MMYLIKVFLRVFWLLLFLLQTLFLVLLILFFRVTSPLYFILTGKSMEKWSDNGFSLTEGKLSDFLFSKIEGYDE